ncbi:hypothetical protein DM860_017913 [Cuscuta australis]|uniref:Uncharacterized protein n=1 Tax=Cuscuta australis TaxID=267555 RepID=A0A328DYY8_9ASTE|nr:hypothetical protein DM860_017913 [Cuscuta australis]
MGLDRESLRRYFRRKYDPWRPFTPRSNRRRYTDRRDGSENLQVWERRRDHRSYPDYWHNSRNRRGYDLHIQGFNTKVSINLTPSEFKPRTEGNVATASGNDKLGREVEDVGIVNPLQLEEFPRVEQAKRNSSLEPLSREEQCLIDGLFNQNLKVQASSLGDPMQSELDLMIIDDKVEEHAGGDLQKHDDDFHRCFKQREWSLGAYKMLISKWTPNFDPNVESPIMPIWISIKNLPIHFHAKESLMQIARIFGNPIKLDSTTENFGRPSIARICVEVDISQPQTNKFFILNREQPVLLEAFYEEVPLFCPECKGISRHKESCTHFKHADSQTKTQARSLDRNIPKGSGKEPVKKQFQQKTDKTPVPSISLSQTSQTIQDKNHHSLPNTDNPLQDSQSAPLISQQTTS